MTWACLPLSSGAQWPLCGKEAGRLRLSSSYMQLSQPAWPISSFKVYCWRTPTTDRNFVGLGLYVEHPWMSFFTGSGKLYISLSLSLSHQYLRGAGWVALFPCHWHECSALGLGLRSAGESVREHTSGHRVDSWGWHMKEGGQASHFWLSLSAWGTCSLAGETQQ